MSYRKLGRTSSERKAMLRGLVTDLLNYGRIETTESRAKEAKRAAEKIITKAIHVYGDTVEVQKTIKGADTKVVNDSSKKLAVRRNIMRYLYDIPAPKQPKESKGDYKKRTKDVKNPVVEKLFREIAPKYAERAKNLGQGGGYTRIIKLGPRRGDGAEMVVLELV